MCARYWNRIYSFRAYLGMGPVFSQLFSQRSLVAAAIATIGFATSFVVSRWAVGASAGSLQQEEVRRVVTQLAQVSVVTDRPTVTGYRRELFYVWDGPADCDTRDRVLAAWFGGGGCSLADGSLRQIPDPYTGDIIGAQDVDIDHVYPLAAAWDYGAFIWDSQRRREFGNDVETNLIPTRSAINREKGDASPSQWLPSSDQACTYAHLYLTVAIKWELPISADDWRALAGACGIRPEK